MSNPAVITLAEIETSVGIFRVEDNIGEAIHLHFGEFRYDLTVAEFLRLVLEIEEMMKEYTSHIPGFFFEQISKEFFLNKSSCWSDLKSARIEKIRLSKLLVDTYDDKGKYIFLPLPNSRVVKALHGNTKENDNRIELNYYGQTNHERVLSMLDSIKRYGYPKDNKYIVIFNNSNVIEDGQHRAACLFYLYGDIEVEVLRIQFIDNKYTTALRRPLMMRLFKWDRKRIRKYYHFAQDKRKCILRDFFNIKSRILLNFDRKRY